MDQRKTDSAWYQQGTNPDYRFSLANERTFLAWIRTILALLATAVVLDQLGGQVERSTALHAAALGLVAVSCFSAGACYLRWRANEICMRHSEALPQTGLLPVLGFVIFGITLVLALYVSI